MVDKRCPACAARAIKRIMYGLPDPEAIESGDMEEFVLGGCCFTPDSPIFECTECHNRFKSLDRPQLSGFKYFRFFLGKPSGPSHYIFIDGDNSRKIIKYGFAEDGRYIDVKESIPGELSDPQAVKIKHIELDKWRWQFFLRQLGLWDLELWAEEYIDNYIKDGTKWKVEIEYLEGNRVVRSGSNGCPPGWQRFMSMLEMHVGERIR